METTIYVQKEQHRHGVGKKLYETLISILRRQNFTIAYAAIALPNEKSVKLHEKMDFKYLCTFPKAGFKLGKWHDVGWWWLELNQMDGVPNPPVHFTDDAGDIGLSVT